MHTCIFIRVFLLQVAVINNTGAPMMLKSPLTLMSFGKISWKKDKSADEDMGEEQTLLVSFTSSSDMVLFDNKLLSLHKVIADRRASNPSWQVCYHTLKDDATPGAAVGAFTLTKALCVRAVMELPKEDAKDKEVRQENLGATLPLGTWEGLPFADIVFSMRWASQGLMPIRPQVVLTQDVEIPAGHGLQLWQN